MRNLLQIVTNVAQYPQSELGISFKYQGIQILLSIESLESGCYPSISQKVTDMDAAATDTPFQARRGRKPEWNLYRGNSRITYLSMKHFGVGLDDIYFVEGID